MSLSFDLPFQEVKLCREDIHPSRRSFKGKKRPFSSDHLDKIVIGQPGMIKLERERAGNRIFHPFKKNRVVVRYHRRIRPNPMPGEKVNKIKGE